jgi:mRNA-degrading endonuclease RelE of RelBE toxin-antitoxin system
VKIQFRASFKRDLKKINDKEVLRLIKKEVKKIESAGDSTSGWQNDKAEK